MWQEPSDRAIAIGAAGVGAVVGVYLFHDLYTSILCAAAFSYGSTTAGRWGRFTKSAGTLGAKAYSKSSEINDQVCCPSAGCKRSPVDLCGHVKASRAWDCAHEMCCRMQSIVWPHTCGRSLHAHPASLFAHAWQLFPPFPLSPFLPLPPRTHPHAAPPAV